MQATGIAGGGGAGANGGGGGGGSDGGSQTHWEAGQKEGKLLQFCRHHALLVVTLTERQVKFLLFQL